MLIFERVSSDTLITFGGFCDSASRLAFRSAFATILHIFEQYLSFGYILKKYFIPEAHLGFWQTLSDRNLPCIHFSVSTICLTVAASLGSR
jgi:hypothetical protein